MRQMEMGAATGTPSVTVVPMRPDFISDRQTALTCISYLPDAISERIRKQLIGPLRTIEPDFYYYPDASLHITIQNIRVIHDPPRFTATDIDIARGVLQQTANNAGPFPFILEGLFMMPTSISVIALVTPEYDRFIKQLRSDLADAGVPDDKTYFTDEMVFANTTIARFTHTPSARFTDLARSIKDTYIGEVLANEMAFVTMNAVATPEKTTVLDVFRFGRN